MKKECDNHCETCPMQSQIYCALMFARATNASLTAIDDRLASLEQAVRPEEVTLINPIHAMPEAGSASMQNEGGEDGDNDDEDENEDDEGTETSTTPQNPISVNPSTPEARATTKH